MQCGGASNHRTYESGCSSRRASKMTRAVQVYGECHFVQRDDEMRQFRKSYLFLLRVAGIHFIIRVLRLKEVHELEDIG